MIERWHRTLKAALMCKNNPQLTQSLPLVLLGLRTAFRDDFSATSSELLYGQNLRLPADFLTPSPNPLSQTEFVSALKKSFDLLRPIPPSRHNRDKLFISADLQTCSHVYVRTDAIRSSLQSPYEGPYSVIRRSDKYFTLLMKNKEANISLNRLKPCFQESSDLAFTTNPSLPFTPSQLTTSCPPNTSSNSEETTPEIRVNPRSVRISPNITSRTYQTTNSRSGRTIHLPIRYR